MELSRQRTRRSGSTGRRKEPEEFRRSKVIRIFLRCFFVSCTILFARNLYVLVTFPAQPEREDEAAASSRATLTLQRPAASTKNPAGAKTPAAELPGGLPGGLPGELPGELPGVDDASNTTTLRRFDEAAPAEKRATVHYLSSIPAGNRLDAAAFRNITAYAENEANGWPGKLLLFEMNPSIVRLPPQYRVPIPTSSSSGEKRVQVAEYVASYRVASKGNRCFGDPEHLLLYGRTWEEFYDRVPNTDHLGIALLGRDYEILADTVVTLFRAKIKHRQMFEDYRLFNLRDTLYLTTYIRVVPLYLSLPGSGGGDDPPAASEGGAKLVKLKSPFRGRRGGLGVWLRDYYSCPVHPNRNTWKNLLYFEGGDGTLCTATYTDPHSVVCHANLSMPCDKAEWDNNRTKPFKTFETTVVDPSFETVDGWDPKLIKRWFTSDRGSACCATIRRRRGEAATSDDGNGTTYFLGLSHPKTGFKGKNRRVNKKGIKANTYFSRFYAFERFPPYRVVARSGKFCLGYPSEEENIAGNETFWTGAGFDPMTYPVSDGVVATFDCPRIHFATGVSDTAFDDSRIVVGYGVMDCLSRFVEFEKSDIADMLWPPRTA